MAIRIPKANTWFQELTDTQLATYAQGVHDGLVASIALFPTPPVLPAALQTLINNYTAALALASGPGAGIINTANKNKAKLLLKDALRQDAAYVNQIVVGEIAGGASYDSMIPVIAATGYQVSKDPVPAGPLGPVVVKKYGSFNKGQYYILLEAMPGAKAYSVRIANVTAGTQIEQAFPGSRITILNLTSGAEYNFSIAAIGANTTRNYGTQIVGQFII